MSDCFPPVPAKLVAEIMKSDYIDKAELLRDNIHVETEHRRVTDNPSASASSNHTNQWEVPDFLFWLQCFGVHACVVASHKPENVPAAHGISNPYDPGGRQCGGTGWQGDVPPTGSHGAQHLFHGPAERRGSQEEAWASQQAWELRPVGQEFSVEGGLRKLGLSNRPRTGDPWEALVEDGGQAERAWRPAGEVLLGRGEQDGRVVSMGQSHWLSGPVMRRMQDGATTT